jgi:hypothetical protein
MSVVRQGSIKALLAPTPLLKGKSNKSFDVELLEAGGSSSLLGSVTTESSQRVS